MESIQSTKEKELTFPMRPTLNMQVRQQQRPVNLISNYLKISFRPNGSFVSQYAIKIEPCVESDNMGLRKTIYKTIYKHLIDTYFPFIISGDSLFSGKQVEEIQVFNIQIRIGETNYEYQISIEKTNNMIDLANIKSVNNFSQKVKSFIEIVFKNILNANEGMVRFNNRSIYDFNKSYQLQECEHAFVMPGYSTNVSITESGIYLRVGIKNKFINSKTCLDKIMELQNNYKNGEYSRKVNDFFKNYSVMTIYGNHKVYKIDAVSFDSHVTNKMINYKDKNGIITEITLQKYYKDQYQRDIKNLDQPLLISYVKNSRGENDPIYLVPELCYLTGMDEDMLSMESLRKSMTSRTKVSPKDRMDKIYDVKSMFYCKNKNKKTRVNKSTGELKTLPDPNEIRQTWGVDIGDFKQFAGRELSTPDILFDKETAQIKGGRFRSSRMLSPVHLDQNSWTIVCSQYNRSAADTFIQSFQRACGQMGLKVDKPRINEHKARNPDEWIDFLKSLDYNNGLRIIMVILDRGTKHIYSNIKRFIYTQVGMPVQVVLKENSSKNLSYFSNVLNQMVVKMGGILYKIPLHNNLSAKPAMIIGYDVVKVGKGKKKFVMAASYDANYSKFYTEECIVDSESEVGPVNSLLRNCLNYFSFHYKNAILPFNFIIYRSGVSEKEKDLILQHEVKSVINLLSGNLTQECYKEGYTAKFTYIIVNKKTESKFFEYSNGNVNNPKEGTVIDSQAVSPGAYEFYIQPQFVNSGTATPTHFQVIYDSIGFPLEDIEDITYKQCYYYWNWSGAIREPAALKFAEVANKFSSTYLQNYVRDRLKNSPYYI